MMVTCEPLTYEGLDQTMKTLALLGVIPYQNDHALPFNDADAEGHDRDLQPFSLPH
jgi:hypothetical protein